MNFSGGIFFGISLAIFWGISERFVFEYLMEIQEKIPKGIHGRTFGGITSEISEEVPGKLPGGIFGKHLEALHGKFLRKFQTKFQRKFLEKLHWEIPTGARKFL